MLKKAGILVAAAAAGLLAVSPLAFAGEGHHHPAGDYSYSDSSIHNKNSGSQGLVNASGNTVQAPIQACNNDVPVNAAGVQTPVKDIAGALSGVAGSVFGDAATGDAESTVNDDRSCGDNGASNDTKSIVK